jgi:hypothetical protein
MKPTIRICCLAVSSSLFLIGCTTYPKNYTYSPTVTVGGDNTGGIALPSPYAKKPQPVPELQQPVYNPMPDPVYDYINNYNISYYENQSCYDEGPLYITDHSSVRVQGPDGVWR